MNVQPTTTIAELMKRFPRGFSIGPGTPDNPGTLSRIVHASSHFSHIAKITGGMAPPNGGFLVVDMDEEPEEERSNV